MWGQGVHVVVRGQDAGGGSLFMGFGGANAGREAWWQDAFNCGATSLSSYFPGLLRMRNLSIFGKWNGQEGITERLQTKHSSKYLLVHITVRNPRGQKSCHHLIP